MFDEYEYLYDAASTAAIGRRDLQEDAIVMHFPEGSGLGYVVLADGMGGHAAGDVASKIVVQEFFAALRQHLEDPANLERNMGAILRDAMDRANDEVARRAADWPDQTGMGSTLVAPLIVRNRLYWISVGDSPLYLLRGSRLTRLNQEHSMARRLDRMVLNGQLSQKDADRNPDRDCLTSVLLGANVPEIDCRDQPLDLAYGDVLIVASDGLLFIDEQRIAGVVYDNRDRTSAEISALLLQEIRSQDDPYQDNVSIGVIKVGRPEAVAPHIVRPVADIVAPHPTLVRRTTIHLHVARKGNLVSRSYSLESEG